MNYVKERGIAIFVFVFSVMILLNNPAITLQSYAKNDSKEVIYEYYDYINNGNPEKIISLYSDYLVDFVAPFFKDENNKKEKSGIYNIIQINDIDISEEPKIKEYIIGDTIYKDVDHFFVKCDMDVEISDKYYRDGANYFEFWISNVDNRYTILNIEIPSMSEIKKYDSDKETVDEYIVERSGYIYGKKVATRGVDSPVYIDYVANPYTINVQGYGAVNFVSYCTTVAACEINTLTTTNGSRAAAMAIKMFSMHCVNNAATGSNYDVTLNQQSYVPGTQISNTASAAISYAMSNFLLDCYGANFRTFYRKQYNSTGAASYAVYHGGVLSQLGCDSLANANYSWQNILKYYYTRSTSIPYYNSQMNYGDLIICTSHYHDWSNSLYCPTCGAEVP